MSVIPAQPGWVVTLDGQTMTVIAWALVGGDSLLPMVYDPRERCARRIEPKEDITARRLFKDPVTKTWI